MVHRPVDQRFAGWQQQRVRLLQKQRTAVGPDQKRAVLHGQPLRLGRCVDFGGEGKVQRVRIDLKPVNVCVQAGQCGQRLVRNRDRRRQQRPNLAISHSSTERAHALYQQHCLALGLIGGKGERK